MQQLVPWRMRWNFGGKIERNDRLCLSGMRAGEGHARTFLSLSNAVRSGAVSLKNDFCRNFVNKFIFLEFLPKDSTSAATNAKTGSMENVWESCKAKLNSSTSTFVPTAKKTIQ